MRIPRMGDQRDSARPERAAVLGPWNLLGEFGREFSVHRRAVNRGLLEKAAAHRCRLAAAALTPPWRASESAGRLTAAELVLEALESRAQFVAQAFEPAARRLFSEGDGNFVHARPGILTLQTVASNGRRSIS